jgi:hypothetical protein
MRVFGASLGWIRLGPVILVVIAAFGCDPSPGGGDAAVDAAVDAEPDVWVGPDCGIVCGPQQECPPHEGPHDVCPDGCSQGCDGVCAGVCGLECDYCDHGEWRTLAVDCCVLPDAGP